MNFLFQVGYGLGRIESINTYEDPSGLIEQPYGASISRPFQGHILSLAVNEKYRGHQVAINMMHLLHHRFATEYGVDSAALFCRVSNSRYYPFHSIAMIMFDIICVLSSLPIKRPCSYTHQNWVIA